MIKVFVREYGQSWFTELEDDKGPVAGAKFLDKTDAEYAKWLVEIALKGPDL